MFRTLAGAVRTASGGTGEGSSSSSSSSSHNGNSNGNNNSNNNNSDNSGNGATRGGTGGSANSGAGDGGDDRNNNNNNNSNNRRNSHIIDVQQRESTDKENSENKDTDNDEEETHTTEELTPRGSIRRVRVKRAKRASQDVKSRVAQVHADVDNVLDLLSNQGCGDMELIDDFDVIEQRMGGDAPSLGPVRRASADAKQSTGAARSASGGRNIGLTTNSGDDASPTTAAAKKTTTVSVKATSYDGPAHAKRRGRAGSGGPIIGFFQQGTAAPSSSSSSASSKARGHSQPTPPPSSSSSSSASSAHRGSKWRVWRLLRGHRRESDDANAPAIYGVSSGKRRVLDIALGTHTFRIAVARATTHEELHSYVVTAAAAQAVALPQGHSIVVSRENSKIMFANMFGGALPYECDKLLDSEGQRFAYVIMTRRRTRQRRRRDRANAEYAALDFHAYDDDDDDDCSYDEGDGRADVFMPPLDFDSASLPAVARTPTKRANSGSGRRRQRRANPSPLHAPSSSSSRQQQRRSLGRSTSETSIASFHSDGSSSAGLAHSDERLK